MLGQPSNLLVISILHILMDTHWWYNDAIEEHVCKLKMGLEKVKFDRIRLIL